jgi:tetratricopeptide (TPR) repeat protein
VEDSANQSLPDAQGRNVFVEEMSRQLRAYIKNYSILCAFSFNFASLREKRFTLEAQSKNVRRTGLNGRLAVCLVVLVASASWGMSQTTEGSVLPPPKQGLSPVHQPDTRHMESEVREHLTAAYNALVAVAEDTAAPVDKLADAYGMMGEIYQAYSLNSSAKESYLNALQLAPKNFRWAYLLGKLHEREGDAQAAINYYNTARNLRPDYLPVFVSLGNIYLQLNRLEEAEGFFRRALELNEASAATQYGLGQTALSKRSYADAVRYLEKAIKLAPEANRIHYALAMAYRGLNNMEKAQSHLALSGSVGVRVSDPLLDGLQELIKGARLHLIRGKIALDARRHADAAEEFRKAIAAQPDSITAHFNLGAALTQTGDWRGAVEQFKETLRLNPNHANANYNLGLLLSREKQHEQAITHLRAALGAQPDDNNARFLLAQSLLNLRRLEEAEAEFASVISSDPNQESALLGLVGILLGKKQYKEALAALEKGHTQFPQKGLTAATLAYLLATSPQLELRDGRRALALAEAVYKATASINHGALVAMALAELGRCEEAADWARRMSARAEAERRPDLLEKLKIELKRYETARPCRPPTQ